jgi:hypothetical protein
MSTLDQSGSQQRPLAVSPVALLDQNTARSQALPPAAEVGTVMIQEGVMLPEGLALDSCRYTVGWRTMRRADDFGIDRNLRKAGWQMFAVAGGNFHAMMLGSLASGLRTTVIRLLARVRAQWFNSAEVTDITSGRFLGISYTSVTVCARHIQQGYPLADERSREQAQQNTDWARS